MGVSRFTYDQAGRRTSMREGNATTTYAYDAAGALISSSVRNQTTTYTSDPAGRRTQVSGRASSETYAYDAAGRLAGVTSTRGEGGARVETRTYDGLGTLVGVAQSGDGDDEGGGDTTLIWDTTLPVPQVVVARQGGADTNLVYGAGRALALRGGDVSVFSYDASHSAIRGDDDELVRAQRYDAFGVAKDSSDTGVTFGYRSEAHIGELVHLRARDYDPATGTFTTRDPLEGIPGTPTATNPYPYADNDPVNQVDPLGLSPSDASFSGLLPWPFPVQRQIWWAGDDASPQLGTTSIAPQPGYGTVRTNLFISACESGYGPFQYRGDCRDFSPTAGPAESRASFSANFETGAFDAFVNYSCRVGGSCKSAYRLLLNPTVGDVCGTPEMTSTTYYCMAAMMNASSPNTVFITPFGRGIKVSYSLTNAASPRDWTPTIDGTITIEPLPGSSRVRVCASGDDYPSLEVYHDVNGATLRVIRDEESQYGPALLVAVFPNRHTCNEA